MNYRRTQGTFANIAFVHITCSAFSPYIPDEEDIFETDISFLYFLSTLFLYKKLAWMLVFSPWFLSYFCHPS